MFSTARSQVVAEGLTFAIPAKDEFSDPVTIELGAREKLVVADYLIDKLETKIENAMTGIHLASSKVPRTLHAPSH